VATAVVMPKLGNTVESSIILSWHKKVGDTVQVGDILCEAETDKAAVEVESPVSGTLLDLFFDEGDEVPVMVNIAAIGDVGENVDALRPQGISAASSAPPAENPAPRSEPQTEVELARPAASVGKNGPPRISPRARHLAERERLNTGNVEGTGPGGRVIERDILAALETRPQMTPVARSMVEQGRFVVPERGTGPGGRISKSDLIPDVAQATEAAPQDSDEAETILLKGVRKVIAERMLSSTQTTAQLTLNTSADARAILAYRKRLKGSDEALGLQKITIGDLVNHAVAHTLPDFHELNALFTGEAIVQYRAAHLGVAVDTPRGLIVPVIRDAHTLSLKQLADETHRLVDACLTGTVKPDELNGGTFTVTNLGAFGIEHFTPILNPPQVGILGVSNINLKPIEVDGEVTHIPHIGLSLTINHQVVDGAPGARFLQALAQRLADIDLLVAL
jgi:pyruvate dehydrogenase E2 component (dihydrolipoamide acetyltransferase)